LVKGNIKWLFFDLGSTLIDETEQEKATAEAISEVLGLSCEDVYDTMVEMSVAYKNPAVETLRILNGSDEQLNLIKESGKYYPSELERIFPGVVDMLKELSGRYKLGVIANQGAGMELRLKNHGIHEFFSIFAGSGDVGVSKPDPAIFLYALKKVGCEAHEAVMIGDRLDNDIYPAKKLGFITIWVKQGLGGHQKPINRDYEADYTVGKIVEVARLF